MSKDKIIRDWCRHGADHLGCDSEYVLIGEAGGKHESERLFPFVGPSGYTLETWWKDVGLTRPNFFITNVVPYQPTDNKIFLVSRDEMQRYGEVLREKLTKLINPHVIVPTGNTALRALFGDSTMNITDYRGSILYWKDLNGRDLIVIPTIHPAATMRQKVLTKLCTADWKRIAYVGKWGHNPIKRHHIVDPSVEEIRAFAGAAEEYFNNLETQLPPRVLSIDVENDIKTKELLCIGFSFDPKVSITVSTLRKDYESEAHFQIAMIFIRTMLSTPIYPVVGQNYMTDLWKLANHFPDIKQPLIDNYVWDLIEMDHALDPNDGGDTSEGSEQASDEGLRIGMRDLGTLCSLYTKEPFYKNEGSHPSQEKRWVYNGKDACVQREIFDVLWWKLYERGLV